MVFRPQGHFIEERPIRLRFDEQVSRGHILGLHKILDPDGVDANEDAHVHCVRRGPVFCTYFKLSRMSAFSMIVTAVVLVLFATIVINSVIGAMSGDRADDPRTTFLDLIKSVLGGFELGLLGRVLESVAGSVVARRLIYIAGGLWLLKVGIDIWVRH